VLIQKMTNTPLSRSPFQTTLAPGRQLSGRVLDIGCGKGGDLQKWQKAKIKEYIALDIAIMSVNAAEKRWTELRGERFDAKFFQLDCYVVRSLGVLLCCVLISASILYRRWSLGISWTIFLMS
jgi:mRNA (guanine-N7-)-methyltransferase